MPSHALIRSRTGRIDRLSNGPAYVRRFRSGSRALRGLHGDDHSPDAPCRL